MLLNPICKKFVLFNLISISFFHVSFTVVGQSGNRTDQHRSSTIDHSRESARHNMMALADHPHQKNVSKDIRGWGLDSV